MGIWDNTLKVENQFLDHSNRISYLLSVRIFKECKIKCILRKQHQVLLLEIKIIFGLTKSIVKLITSVVLHDGIANLIEGHLYCNSVSLTHLRLIRDLSAIFEGPKSVCACSSSALETLE